MRQHLIGSQSRSREVTPVPAPAKPIDILAIAEGALLADIAVVLAALSIYIPVVGPFIEMAIPAPFALLVMRRGLRVTSMAILVGIFLLALISGPVNCLRILAMGAIGLYLGLVMKRKLHPWLVIVLGVLTSALGFEGLFVAFTLLFGQSITDIRKEIGGLLTGAVQVITVASTGHWWLPYWQQLMPLLTWLIRIALQFWPLSLYLILCAYCFGPVISFYMFNNLILSYLGFEVRPFPPAHTQQRLKLLRQKLYRFAQTSSAIVRLLRLPKHRKSSPVASEEAGLTTEARLRSEEGEIPQSFRGKR